MKCVDCKYRKNCQFLDRNKNRLEKGSFCIEDCTAYEKDVIHCKDCDLWNEWDMAGHKQNGNFVCSCAYFSNEDGYAVYTGPDDYCSKGERKEDKL